MAATSSARSWTSLVSGWLSWSSVAGSLWTGGGVAVGVAVGGVSREWPCSVAACTCRNGRLNTVLYSMGVLYSTASSVCDDRYQACTFAWDKLCALFIYSALDDATMLKQAPFYSF